MPQLKKSDYTTSELIEIASQLKESAEARAIYNHSEKQKRDIEIKYHRQMLVYLKAKFNQEQQQQNKGLFN